MPLNQLKHKYVFGPVPSRRLGRSLGVDLIPLKTCSFNCIYCQLGRGRFTTLVRDEYVPAEAVLQELEAALAAGPPPDYVTLSGSGEPTLHARLAEIIIFIKRLTTVPVAVLTNGSTLSDPEVREACGHADVILPTLAAHNEELFQRIHRPAPGMTLAKHIDGLIAFRAEQQTPMWIELFLLEGVNAAGDDLRAFTTLLQRIRPHAVQLNTAVRPTAERYAMVVSQGKLDRWAEALGEHAQVIAAAPETRGCQSSAGISDAVELCRRHPSTEYDIAIALGWTPQRTTQALTELVKAGQLRAEDRDGRTFYRVPDTETDANPPAAS